VHPELFAVEIDMGLVIDRAKIEEIAVVGLSGQLEGTPVPDRTLIIEEFVVLGVPVAGNLERGAAIEVVFDELALIGLLFIVEETAGAGRLLVIGLVAVVVETVLIRVDDIIPAAIEIEGYARRDVLDDAVLRHCGTHRDEDPDEDEDCEQDIKRFFHLPRISAGS
jgi:hypothetical protein